MIEVLRFFKLGRGKTSSKEGAVVDKIDRLYNARTLVEEWENFFASHSIPISRLSAPSDEELAVLGKEKRLPILDPGSEVLSYEVIKEKFPELHLEKCQLPGKTFDENKEPCWIHTELSSDAPNLNQTEDRIRRLFYLPGKQPLRFRNYLLGSIFYKHLFGKYFDEGITSSILLDSFINGSAMCVFHHPDGHVFTAYYPGDKPASPVKGWRSEGTSI